MKLVPLTVVATFLVAGCASIADEPKPVVTTVVDERILSSTASVANTLILDKNTNFVTCTAPQPDAAFAQGSQASVTGLVAVSGGNDSGGIGEGEESKETSLGGRTPAILFSRDLFFRTCEFSRNYELTKDEALTLYNSTMQAAAAAFDAETTATNTSMTQSQAETGDLEEPISPPN